LFNFIVQKYDSSLPSAKGNIKSIFNDLDLRIKIFLKYSFLRHSTKVGIHNILANKRFGLSGQACLLQAAG